MTPKKVERERSTNKIMWLKSWPQRRLWSDSRINKTLLSVYTSSVFIQIDVLEEKKVPGKGSGACRSWDRLCSPCLWYWCHDSYTLNIAFHAPPPDSLTLLQRLHSSPLHKDTHVTRHVRLFQFLSDVCATRYRGPVLWPYEWRDNEKLLQIDEWNRTFIMLAVRPFHSERTPLFLTTCMKQSIIPLKWTSTLPQWGRWALCAWEKNKKKSHDVSIK